MPRKAFVFSFSPFIGLAMNELRGREWLTPLNIKRPTNTTATHKCCDGLPFSALACVFCFNITAAHESSGNR